MDKETKDVYGVLQDIYKNVWEQQKYSEIKNSVLLTFNIAILILVSRLYFYISNTINSSLLYKVSFLILILILMVHIILIIQSFFPKVSNKEVLKRTINDTNIFFFGDIQKLRSQDYLEIVLQRLDAKEEDNKPLLLDLSNQIVKLSEITQQKYSAFKYSVYRMYAVGTLFMAFFLCLFFDVK